MTRPSFTRPDGLGRATDGGKRANNTCHQSERSELGRNPASSRPSRPVPRRRTNAMATRRSTPGVVSGRPTDRTGKAVRRVAHACPGAPLSSLGRRTSAAT